MASRWFDVVGLALVLIVYGSWLAVRRPTLAAAVVVLLLPLAAWEAVRRYRAGVVRDRLTAGLCAACGYDLRATPDRCPECGRPRERHTDS